MMPRCGDLLSPAPFSLARPSPSRAVHGCPVGWPEGVLPSGSHRVNRPPARCPWFGSSTPALQSIISPLNHCPQVPSYTRLCWSCAVPWCWSSMGINGSGALLLHSRITCADAVASLWGPFGPDSGSMVAVLRSTGEDALLLKRCPQVRRRPVPAGGCAGACCRRRIGYSSSAATRVARGRAAAGVGAGWPLLEGILFNVPSAVM